MVMVEQTLYARHTTNTPTEKFIQQRVRNKLVGLIVSGVFLQYSRLRQPVLKLGFGLGFGLGFE